MSAASLTIAIPCLDEEHAVRAVVAEYRAAFPDAQILVIDNGSTDRTAEEARAAGALVVMEPRRGKAQAMQRAFELSGTRLLLMVDGDGSYPAEGARRLIETQRETDADMVTGVRRAADNRGVFRPMHQSGMHLFARVLGLSFGVTPRDLFSGLRLMTWRFYKSTPVLSRGFELELELTIQAIDKSFSMAEVDVPFRARAAGTASKLRTLADGMRILRLLVVLLRDYKPLAFFGSASAALVAAGLTAGSLPVIEYFQTGLVLRLPLAVLAASLMILAALALLAGLLLESGLRHHREAYQLRLRHLGASPEGIGARQLAPSGDRVVGDATPVRRG